MPGEVDLTLLLGSAGTALYCLGYLWWSLAHRRLAAPAALHAGLVLVHFGLPGVLLALGLGPAFSHEPNRAYAAEASAFALASLLALQIGSGGFRAQPRRAQEGAHSHAWAGNRLLAVVVLLVAVGWGVRAYVIAQDAYFQIARVTQGELEGPFYAMIRMVEQFPLWAMVALAIRAYRPTWEPSRFWQRVLWLSMLTELLYWMPTGRKEETIYVFLLPGLVWYLRRLRLPSRKVLAAFALFVALLFPSMHYYRAAMELGGTIHGVTQTVTLATSGLGETRSALDVSTFDILVGRVSLMEPMSACARLSHEGGWAATPGQSYAAGLFGVVPRFLWPSKPDLHYGTVFGDAAGILGAGDTTTSISVSFPGEAFLNFGWGGLIPLLGIGLFFGWLHRSHRRDPGSETRLLLYMMVVPTLLFLGGTFSMYFGGLIKLLPLFLILGRAMEGRQAQVPHATPPMPAEA